MSRNIVAHGLAARIRFLAAFIVLSILLAACKAQTLSTMPQDFSLKITFPMEAVSAAPFVGGGRLLLPNAATLAVTMVPQDFRFARLESVVSIPSEATSVIVPFAKVPEGSWTVTAIASDIGGKKLFGQTMTIDISAAKPSWDFYLLPLQFSPLQSPGVAPTQFPSRDVPAHDSISWIVPAEAIKPDGSFEIWLDPSTGLKGAYVQSADGRSAAYPISQSGIGSLVTVYNPSNSPAKALLLLDPYHVTYDANQGTYQNASGVSPKDLDSAGYAKGYGPSTDYAKATALGAGTLAIKGYSFNGWNTNADGKGTTYKVGDSLAVASDTALHAQWAQIHVASISLDKITAGLLVGATDTLTATVSPSDALDPSFTWSSSDSNIVTVDNGTIKGLALGSAVIKATTADGALSSSCAVTVTNVAVPVTGVSVSPTTAPLKKGDTTTLVATISPTDATDSTVTWSSDDATVATVDKAGVVTAVGVGTAKITVKTGDGGYTASCSVAVEATSSITVTFSIVPDLTQVLSFSPTTLTVTSSGTVSIATDNSALAGSGSEWRWSIDGIIDAAATSSTYARTMTSADIGQHIVGASCLYNGVRYSGNLMIWVTR